MICVKRKGGKRGRNGENGRFSGNAGEIPKISGGNAPDTVAGTAFGKKEEGKGGNRADAEGTDFALGK